MIGNKSNTYNVLFIPTFVTIPINFYLTVIRRRETYEVKGVPSPWRLVIQTIILPSS